jgi:hypothetical protein
MADKDTVVHIGENSPEHVAYRLTHVILFELEGKARKGTPRKEYLDTFAECLDAVRGHRDWAKK